MVRAKLVGLFVTICYTESNYWWELIIVIRGEPIY